MQVNRLLSAQFLYLLWWHQPKYTKVGKSFFSQLFKNVVFKIAQFFYYHCLYRWIVFFNFNNYKVLLQKLNKNPKFFLLVVCSFLGTTSRWVCPRPLWTVWPQRSIPGPAAGRRSRRAAECAQSTPSRSARPGGGPKPSGCAETGHDSLQEDAGEDDGTVGCCREQTQEGKWQMMPICSQ